jgi:hypothetical protein
MTEDLKHKFEQLVADPPPPSAVPSEAVFARVRSVRRRRTAGVVTLAAAAVVAVAVAAGNLTDIRSEPPVTGTSTTVVTASPTATPTTGNTAGATKGTAGPTSTTTTTTTPVTSPLVANVVLKPTVKGRTVTMNVTVSGTVLVPTADGRNLPADTSFLDLSGGTTYDFGDGYTSGSDGGGVLCAKSSKKRTTGRETYQLETHTYTKPGTYTFHYTVEYCGANGWFNTNKTTQLVIK